MDPSSGVLAWTPSLGLENRNVGFRVGVRDVTGLQAMASVTIYVQPATVAVNRAPRITSTPSPSVQVGSEYVYQLTAQDADGDLVQLTAPLLAAGATFDATTGILRWTPTQAGSGSFRLTAADPWANQGSQQRS